MKPTLSTQWQSEDRNKLNAMLCWSLNIRLPKLNIAIKSNEGWMRKISIRKLTSNNHYHMAVNKKINIYCIRTFELIIKTVGFSCIKTSLQRTYGNEKKIPNQFSINRFTYTLHVLFGNCWMMPAAVRDIETFKTFPYWPKYSLRCRSCIRDALN